MKICVEENIPQVTVDELKRMGHEVIDMPHLNSKNLWHWWENERCVLITTNGKFFELAREDTHPGVIIVHDFGLTEQEVHQKIIQAIIKFKEWYSLIVVLDEGPLQLFRTL